MERNNENKAKMRFVDITILFLLSLYFLLKPFYLWNSGLPQISDCVLLLTMVIYIIKNGFFIRFYTQSKSFICASMGFVLCVLSTNIVWSLILGGNLEFLIASAFYIYNFLASLMIVMLYHEYNDHFFKHIYIMIFVSTLTQLTIYLVSGGFKGERALGFFNNPNQLGYYNLLVLGFLVMIKQRTKLKTWWFICSIFASLILCFSSLSKAAIIAYSGMLLLFLLMKTKVKVYRKKTIIYLFVTILILSIACYSKGEIIASNQLYKSVIGRISEIGSESDDNLSARGYDRITNCPQYLAFGAGEGGFLRFGYDMEFHSTLGNILVSYGLTGLFLYLVSIMLALKNSKWKDAYIVLFILLYGLTHNGIRNTLLWMLIALISVGITSTNDAKHGN